MIVPMIAFGIWLVLLTVLNFLFWLRPTSLFPRPSQSQGFLQQDMASVTASLLAILLFVSCYVLGVWLSLADWGMTK